VEHHGDHRVEIFSGSEPTDQSLARLTNFFGEGQAEGSPRTRACSARQHEWTIRQAEWQAARDRELAQEASRDRLRSILYESLRSFEKDTQSRSVGISLVEAELGAFAEFRAVWLAVLANQLLFEVRRGLRRTRPWGSAPRGLEVT
jgi:hypothetical protein